LLRPVEQANTLPCGHEVCPSCRLKAEEADEEEDEVARTCRTCQSALKVETTAVPSGDTRMRSAKVEALIHKLREEQRPGVDGAVQKR
jgi:hypothetical protein